MLDTPDGWFRSIHLFLHSIILRHFTTFVYFDAGHEVFQLNQYTHYTGSQSAPNPVANLSSKQSCGNIT